MVTKWLFYGVYLYESMEYDDGSNCGYFLFNNVVSHRTEEKDLIYETTLLDTAMISQHLFISSIQKRISH